MLDINGHSIYFQAECCNLRRLAAVRTETGPQHRTGRQIGRVCVFFGCVSKRAGSGRGHLSHLIHRESVTLDHMVESVAPGQGQAKTFPQSELIRGTNREGERVSLAKTQDGNTPCYTADGFKT